MRHENLRVGLVLIGVYALLLLAAFRLGDLYVTAWLPLLKLEVQWLLPKGLRCDSVVLVSQQAQRLIELHAVTTIRQAFANGVLPAGVALKASTLQAYVLYHPVIIFATLAAWPAHGWRRRIALLLLGIPCVLITTSLDIPFVLGGLAQDLILGNFAPTDARNDPRALYYTFVHGGGRLGIAVAGALCTALIAQRLRSRATARTKVATCRSVNSSVQKRHRAAAPGR
jgi:hypothetical protein